MNEVYLLVNEAPRCFPLRSFHFKFPISSSEFHASDETLSSRKLYRARGESCQSRLLLEKMEKDGIFSPKFVYIALKLNLRSYSILTNGIQPPHHYFYAHHHQKYSGNGQILQYPHHRR